MTFNKRSTFDAYFVCSKDRQMFAKSYLHGMHSWERLQLLEFVRYEKRTRWDGKNVSVEGERAKRRRTGMAVAPPFATR